MWEYIVQILGVVAIILAVSGPVLYVRAKMEEELEELLETEERIMMKYHPAYKRYKYIYVQENGKLRLKRVEA